VTSQRKLTLSAESMALLQDQTYPGNVRELRNLLERAALLCDGMVLEANHVMEALSSGRRADFGPALKPSNSTTLGSTPAGAIEQLDSHAPELKRPTTGALNAAALAALHALVKSHTGSRAELAGKLGISERSLYRKLKALNLT
jgi:DNA-binding NtrC family response regulator